jgi:hypothetical protein
MARLMERHGLRQRRACRLVGIEHSTLRYRPRRPDDGALRKRLRELAHERQRFGYRRLGWLLSREGHAMNHKLAAIRNRIVHQSDAALAVYKRSLRSVYGISIAPQPDDF